MIMMAVTVGRDDGDNSEVVWEEREPIDEQVL